MNLNINKKSLRSGHLFNSGSEHLCALGAVCRAAGINDEEMSTRRSIVFKKKPDEKNAQGQVTKTFAVKELPEELVPFFIEDTGWEPIGESFRGSRKFIFTELGRSVAKINDTRTINWVEKLTETLSYGGVDITWEE